MYIQFASFVGCLAKLLFLEIVYEVDKESTYILYFSVLYLKSKEIKNTNQTQLK
jgi:hypothetical protein